MRTRFLLFFFCIAFPFSGVAQLCTGSLGNPVVHIDFGAGGVQGQPLGSAVTDYAFKNEDCPTDGQYTIRSSTANCFNNTWFTLTQDHTPGDTNGHMMIINADYTPGVFYRQEVNGLCANTTYEFAAWLMSIPSVNLVKDPNITFRIEKPDGTLLQDMDTGNILETNMPQWKQYGMQFQTPSGVSNIVLVMRNNGEGGSGNDLVLDDITFRPCGPDLNPQVAQTNTAETHICEGAYENVELKIGDPSLFYTSPKLQWQLSTDGRNWIDIAGAEAKSYAVSFNNAAVGTYYYRVLAAEEENFNSENCRVASNPVTIIVDPAPVIPDAVTVCEGETLQLPLQARGSYSWTGPGGFTSSDQNPVITSIDQIQAGEYRVVINNGLCTEIRAIMVSVNSKPAADAGPDAAICFGGSTVLNASGGIAYQWHPAEGLSDPNAANPIASPQHTTVYTVTVTGANGCMASDQVQVSVFEPISVDAGPDLVTVAGKPVQLQAVVNKDPAEFDVFWSPADGLTAADILSPTALPAADMFYTIRVVPKSGCIEAVDTVFVRVYQDLDIPNTFSPNGDGVNDLWNITPLEAYPQSLLTVYNRYGKVVFKTEGNAQLWNGQFNGEDLPVGIYYYVLNFNEPDKKTRSGWVSIIR